VPSPFRFTTDLLTRRVWLPRWLYASVPWLYLVLGGTALASALAVPEPGWIVPLAAVAGLALLHLGLWVATVRHRRRLRNQGAGPLKDAPAP
jgi:hypothetical protein